MGMIPLFKESIGYLSILMIVIIVGVEFIKIVKERTRAKDSKKISKTISIIIVTVTAFGSLSYFIFFNL